MKSIEVWDKWLCNNANDSYEWIEEWVSTNKIGGLLSLEKDTTNSLDRNIILFKRILKYQKILIWWIWIWYTEPTVNQQQANSSAMAVSSSTKEQHYQQQQQYSSSSHMMSSTKRSAKISNASTVSNASSNLTVPNALCGLSDDEGTYQALSVVFEDSTNPRKKSKG